MRRLFTPDEFARLAQSEQSNPQTSVATTSVSAPEFGESGRIVRYTFSTPAVGRDFHTVAADAWQLKNFNRNPVFLWAHDDSQPPIGRVVQIGNVGDVLKGDVEYAERDLSPFADTIYRLVRAGYLNAVSTSWQPLEWSFSRDKNRPGGVDFSKVDMLEISQVPIPALPSALAEARSHGIDTTPIRQWAERLLDSGGLSVVPRTELETLRRAATMTVRRQRAGSTSDSDWKVGVAKDLPIEDSDSWDGPAAEKSVFEWAAEGKADGEFDAEKARKAFLVYDAAKPELKGSYKLPIAHVVGGELKVPKGAIRAAASRLPDTDIPDNVKKRATAALNAYKKKAGIGDENDTEEERALKTKHVRALSRAPQIPTFTRGLYQVAQLACMLEELGYACFAAEYEADIEGDDSKVPGMLGEALSRLGEALTAMTEEEVAELLAQHDDEADDGETAETRSLPADKRAWVSDGKTPQIRAWRAGVAVARAGRALSASNRKTLEEADGHQERAMKHHRAMADSQKTAKGHLDEAQESHERSTQTLAELGEHTRAAAAAATPVEASQHLEKAAKAHRAMGDHLEEMAASHRKLEDAHEDTDDAHHAMGRSVKRAQRCMRSVIEGAQTSEADEPEAKALETSEAGKSEQARANREAIVRRLRGPLVIEAD